MGSIPLTVPRVYGAMSVEIPPMRRSFTGWGAQLQGDERYLLQRIVILERHYAFQQQ